MSNNAQTIAIVTNSKGFEEAVKARLQSQARYKGVTFVTVEKLSDRPAGCDRVAMLGAPSFIPGSEPVKVLSMGTRNLPDAADRSAQWEMLRDKDSTVEEILPELTNPSELLIFNGQVYSELKVNLAEHRIAIADAETPEQKLAAYEEAYKFLLAYVS